MGRASELVFPHEQTFAAVSENGPLLPGVFRGRISRRGTAGRLRAQAACTPSPDWAWTWNPTPEKLAALPDPHDWILQGKVAYAEFVPTPDGPRSKAEIRLMFLWPEDGEPILACNLVRMSQGKMMGVDFNKEKTWVGSSIGLMPPGVW